MEKIDLENFPTSESAKKMLSYVSDGFYDESYVGKWLFQVMGVEYDKALEIVENLPAQFFLETATWGLIYHEIKWGLPVRLNLPYEERRRLIYQKRDYRAPMTPYHMEIYLENATGFKVRIVDMNDSGIYNFVPPHPNVFKVYFLGEETLNSQFVKNILNGLKQSHTTYILNDRIEVSIKCNEAEKAVLVKLYFMMRIPLLPYRSYNGTSCYDGKTRYDARRRYELGTALGIHCKIVGFGEQISNLAIETRRNIQYYNGKVRYDGKMKYNALLRKDIVE